MKLRRWRVFCVMNLLFFALSLLISCSAQQQDDQQLESSQQEEQQYEQQDDADQVEGEESAHGQSKMEAADNSAGSEAGESFELANEGNYQYQSLDGGDNLLGSENGSENPALQEDGNSLANIMNDLGQTDPNPVQEAGGGDHVTASDAANAGFATSNQIGAANLTPSASGGVVSGAAGPAAGPGLPEFGSRMSYVVVKGDTLAKISAKIYGTIGKWRELARISRFENPSRIYPGDLVYYQLTQESLTFASSYENTSRGELVVKKGETLRGIAKRVYGSSDNWKSIWRQNHHIKDPDQIAHGAVLYFLGQSVNTAAPTTGQAAAAIEVAVQNHLLGVQQANMIKEAGESRTESLLDSWDSFLSHWNA